jgi:hypothetical protein
LLKNKNGEEEDHLRSKSVLVLTLIVLMLMLSFFVPFAHTTEDGVADYLLAHTYMSIVAELSALELCDLDIADAQLTKYWVDRFTGNPSIQMKDYAKLEIFDFDLNNQRWPTGVAVPREYDPCSGTYKHFFDDGGTPGIVDTWDEVAREFRKALAYLTNKDAYITEILKGYGYKIESKIPIPALGGYTDYAHLAYKGLIYDYDPCQAAAILDEVGFVEGTTPNPYYHPDHPCSAQFIRIDPRYSGDLAPLEMYVRMDDTLKSEAADMFIEELRTAGIPVDAHYIARIWCYNQVMKLYDYHIYTSNFFVGPDIDYLEWLFHSQMYYGGDETSYYDGVAWSPNYIGFCNHQYDYWAEVLSSATTAAEAKEAALECQQVFAEQVGSIPVWTRAGVKAYKTGWDGVVNMGGYGVDNRWSFMNMYNPFARTIDYGISSNLDSLNIIITISPYDRKILDVIYDSLIGLNPYNFAEDVELLAESWTTGPWSGGMYCQFTLKDGVTFHDGSPVEAYDVAFSEVFPRDCGPGVCGYIADVKHIDHVEIQSIPSGVPSHPDIVANPALAADEVVVYLDIASCFGLHWAGGVPILNSEVWLAANEYFGWGWPASGWDRYAVWDYHPWEHDVDGLGVDLDENGVVEDWEKYDMIQDGAGTWMYHSTETPNAISGTTWVYLKRYPNYHMTNTEIANNINYWFHKIGNVNYPGSVHEPEYPVIDMVIDAIDGSYIFRAWGTTPAWPHGINWYEWNEDCDFNEDNKIDASDLYLFCLSYGKTADC